MLTTLVVPPTAKQAHMPGTAWALEQGCCCPVNQPGAPSKFIFDRDCCVHVVKKSKADS